MFVMAMFGTSLLQAQQTTNLQRIASAIYAAPPSYKNISKFSFITFMINEKYSGTGISRDSLLTLYIKELATEEYQKCKHNEEAWNQLKNKFRFLIETYTSYYTEYCSAPMEIPWTKYNKQSQKLSLSRIKRPAKLFQYQLKTDHTNA